MGLRTSCALGVLAVLLAAAPAVATVLADVPIEDMAFDADAIVIGRVERVGVRVELAGGNAEPWTVTTVRVERWLAGGTPGARTLDIEERGGTLQDGSGMRVAGTPEYRAGERVLVFVRVDPLGRHRTYGMVQGRFVLRAAVDGPTVAMRDMSDVAVAHWTGGQMQVAHGGVEELPLDVLLARVQVAIGARR